MVSPASLQGKNFGTRQLRTLLFILAIGSLIEFRFSRNALTLCGIHCNILTLLKSWKPLLDLGFGYLRFFLSSDIL
jgi:hypothetical protein